MHCAFLTVFKLHTLFTGSKISKKNGLFGKITALKIKIRLQT